jgi:hypothetical protein
MMALSRVGAVAQSQAAVTERSPTMVVSTQVGEA